MKKVKKSKPVFALTLAFVEQTIRDRKKATKEASRYKSLVRGLQNKIADLQDTLEDEKRLSKIHLHDSKGYLLNGMLERIATAIESREVKTEGSSAEEIAGSLRKLKA